jgi:CHASE3 domain sensor protein
MTQELFNIVVGIAGALGGWWLKVMWETLKDLQKADKELAAKVSEIEVLVAGNYVKRDSFDSAVERIFQKLDHIEEKIDKKADK